jgi:hypothetical protein
MEVILVVSDFRLKRTRVHSNDAPLSMQQFSLNMANPRSDEKAIARGISPMELETYEIVGHPASDGKQHSAAIFGLGVTHK